MHLRSNQPGVILEGRHDRLGLGQTGGVALQFACGNGNRRQRRRQLVGGASCERRERCEALAPRGAIACVIELLLPLRERPLARAST